MRSARALLLAALCLLAFLAFPADAQWPPWGGRTSWGGNWNAPNRTTSWSEIFSYDFSAARSRLPTCTTGNNCAIQCYPVGTTWTCVNGAGAAVAVTQGTGATGADSPWGRVLTDITDAQAPRLTTPGDASSLWAAPHTVVVVGHSSGRTTSAAQWAFTQNDGSNGIGMRGEGAGTFRCQWRNSGATPDSVSVLGTLGTMNAGITVSSCIKEGTGAASVYRARVGGAEVSDSSWDWNPGAPTGINAWFGRDVGGGAPWRGPLVSVTIYSAAKSVSEMQAIEREVAGGTVLTDGMPNASVKRWVMDANGVAWPTRLSRVVQDAGLYVEEHDLNGGNGGNWATDALDANSWTSVGTPIITQNTQSGPFSTYMGGAEADLIEDDAAGAFEGKTGTRNCGGTAVGKFTVSCYVRTGTTGTVTTQATLRITTNGTGSVDCAFTDLTSSFVRKECVTTVGGSPTSTVGTVLVGDAAADTGSIVVSQCQCDRHGWATSPKADDNSGGLDTPEIPATTTALWPSDGDSGEIETVFTVDHDVPGDDYDNGDSFFLHDVDNAAETEHVAFDLYQQSGGGYHTMFTGTTGSSSTPDSSQWTLVAGTTYVSKIRWVAHGAGRVDHYLYFDSCAAPASCAATTLTASSTDGSRIDPVQPFGPMILGRRYTDTFPLDGKLLRITVRQRVP